MSLDEPALAVPLTGALVGVAAAILGPFLVLRQQSMLSDAISHSIVFGIVTVWLTTGAADGPVQILGAALTGVLTVWLTELLASTGRVKDDAAIGLVFPVLFALGVLLLNLYARNVHIDAHTVLLGEIGFVWLDVVEIGGVAVPDAILWLSAVVAINGIFVAALWKELKLATFDPMLARALGFRPGLLRYALLFLTSATAVAAFDAVGAILFVAFVIVPPASAYLLTDRLPAMLGLGCAIGVGAAWGGDAAATALDINIGAAMAVATGVALVAAFVAGPRHGLVAQILRRRAEAEEARLRALVVHLWTHEGTGAERTENAASALSAHLRWSPPEAAGLTARAVSRGWVHRAGPALRLTETGRAVARAVLEPWRRD